MKLLLDTHAFLWFIMGSASLSVNGRALIEDPANERFLSVASLWGNRHQDKHRETVPILSFR